MLLSPPSNVPCRSPVDECVPHTECAEAASLFTARLPLSMRGREGEGEREAEVTAAPPSQSATTNYGAAASVLYGGGPDSGHHFLEISTRHHDFHLETPSDVRLRPSGAPCERVRRQV